MEPSKWFGLNLRDLQAIIIHLKSGSYKYFSLFDIKVQPVLKSVNILCF